MRKIWNWILKELILIVHVDPKNNIYTAKLGLLWIIYLLFRMFGDLIFKAFAS